MVNRIWIVVVAAGALALAGCGGGGGDGGDGATTEAAPAVIEGFRVLKTIDIHEHEFAFEPATIRVDRVAIYGLRIFNDGKEPHSFEISGPRLHRTIGNIQPGESTTIAVFFRKRADYEFTCPLDDHAGKGMRGVITVGPR
jgi:plastocyanin